MKVLMYKGHKATIYPPKVKFYSQIHQIYTCHRQGNWCMRKCKATSLTLSFSGSKFELYLKGFTPF